MAYAPTFLARSNVASTTETTVYTVGVGLQCIVKQIVVANVTATAAVTSLSIVPSGGAAGVTNRLYEQVSIPANSTVSYDLSQVMNAGDFISVKQGTASGITTTLSGVELTAASAAGAFTIFDAKGDLVAATAADTAARLAVGTNGQVLTAASGEATGLQWAAPLGAGFVQGDGAGDHTTTSTTFVDVAAAYSATLAAVAGDRLEMRFEGMVNHSVSAIGSYVYFGFAVNSVDVGPTNGYKAIGCSNNGILFPLGASAWRTVVAGDISGGNVTVKARWKGVTGTKTLKNGAAEIPVFSVKNWKQ